MRLKLYLVIFTSLALAGALSVLSMELFVELTSEQMLCQGREESICRTPVSEKLPRVLVSAAISTASIAVFVTLYHWIADPHETSGV